MNNSIEILYELIKCHKNIGFIIKIFCKPLSITKFIS